MGIFFCLRMQMFILLSNLFIFNIPKWNHNYYFFLCVCVRYYFNEDFNYDDFFLNEEWRKKKLKITNECPILANNNNIQRIKRINGIKWNKIKAKKNWRDSISSVEFIMSVRIWLLFLIIRVCVCVWVCCAVCTYAIHPFDIHIQQK